MASVALGYAGQAIGGAFGGPLGAAIGGMIGSAIGGMVDNQLFPQKEVGPRLTDLTLTASSYGKPLPLIFGPTNRLAGNVIWSTGLLETTTKTKSGGKGGPTVKTTTYSYRASFAVALGEASIPGSTAAPRQISRILKVWMNSKLIYDVDGELEVETALYAGFRIYTGSHTQLPDPTIESYRGVGETPAYRGTAYVVFEDLQLADFGNRLPNIEFLVEGDAAITVGEIVGEIVARCGLDLNQVSTSTLVDSVRGYVVGSQASGIGALQPLALAYDFDVAEVGGGLRCNKRGASALGVILLEQLAGHDGQAVRPDDELLWKRMRTTALPREATITFSDPGRDYQPNTQRAVRSQGSAQSNLSSEIAIVLDVDEGRRLADRMLWEAWTGVQTAVAQTDDRWISIEPGRVYLFETPAGFEPLRILRKTRGANGVIDLDIKRDRDEVYASTATGVVAPALPNPMALPGLTELILLDIPLLLEADDATTGPGFYWGVVGSGAGWRGADFLRAIDVAGPYENIAPQGIELTVGAADLLEPPTAGFDPDADWDMVNVVTVTLRRPDMTLDSAVDDVVLAGANAAYVGPADGHGGEIIQFADADLVAPGVYELSRLRRGQRGTDFAWGDHGSDEIFVLLEEGVLQRANFGAGDLNLERAYKAVSLLTFPDDTDPIIWENTGVGLRPYPPADLLADGVSGGDVELSWIRRDRGAYGAPELVEEYQLEIRNVAGTATVRTVVLPSPEFTYTTAMQTADFGAPVVSLRWRVAQVGSVFGVGAFAESSGPV